MFNKREKKTKVYHLDNDTKEPINVPMPQHHDFLSKKRGIDNDFSTNPSAAAFHKKSCVNAYEDTFYKSSLELKNNNTATREIEIDTDYKLDAQAIRERNIQISKDKLEGRIANDAYTGKNTSIIYAQKSERDLSRYKITGSLGPMRAPKNLRVNCRFDYAPGICKDYKETGSCGYGDSCVFLHDRGDYKSGWELEEEWNREQRRKAKKKAKGIAKENGCDSHDDDDDEGSNEGNNETLCGICREEMKEPIVTNCSHYFCQSCAIAFYAKNHHCASCDKPTNGLFHNATAVIEHIRRNKSKLQSRKSKPNNTQEKNNHSHNDINDNDNDDGLSYLDNHHYATENITNDETDSNIIQFTKDTKKKKNQAKIQNDWLYPSDYRTYD